MRFKGYLTNTDIPVSEVYAAYHNLWHVERPFRISKSKNAAKAGLSNGHVVTNMLC